MEVKKITLLFTILVCCFSCGDNHTEPDENENPDNAATIYDLFPKYHHYEYLYLYQRTIILKNKQNGDTKEFLIDDKGKLVDGINSEWEIPDDAPYLYNQHFNAVRLIMPNEVCYKEALNLFPNYFYYECLLRFENAYELENVATKELQTFDIYNAERLLRNPNGEWKIASNAPYSLDSVSGIKIIKIKDICTYLSNQ